MSHGIGVIKMKIDNCFKVFSKSIGVCVGILVLTSCNTIDKDTTKVKFAASGYPNMFKPVRVDLAESKLSGAIDKNHSIGNIKQLKNLNSLESGRLLQLDDKFQDSINAYDSAIKTIPTSEKESIKQAKATLLNKNTYNYYDIKSAYNIPDFATTFLYTYQSLNYLKTNDAKKALDVLNNIDNVKFWANQQDIIAEGMKHIGKKNLEHNDIKVDDLNLNAFKALNEMLKFSNRIPNAYGNPLSSYLKAMLLSSVLKDYSTALTSLNVAQKYTVGNKYLERTVAEFSAALRSGNSPHSMGMGRVVVFYEQGLVNIRQSATAKLDLGNIGDKKLDLPIYSTKYNFYEPKQVVISVGDKEIVNTYTETLMDTTLFAMKSLTDEYSRIITQNMVIEAYKHDYEQNFALGGILGSHLKFNISKTEPKRADLRSWLLLPSSVDLFEQQIDSGDYTIQINNIRQNIQVQQGKTTLLWIVDVGSFKKVYYFIV